MADISIPKLNRLDANTVANTDVLLIVDDPQGNPENKKIQVGELFSGSQSERLPNDGLKVALASDEDKDNANDVVIIEATYSGLHNILLEDGGLLLIDSTDGSADAGDNIKLELQELRIGDPTLTTYLDGNTVTQNGYFSIGELATVTAATAGITGMMVANDSFLQICTVGGTSGNATWKTLKFLSVDAILLESDAGDPTDRDHVLLDSTDGSSDAGGHILQD